MCRGRGVPGKKTTRGSGNTANSRSHSTGNKFVAETDTHGSKARGCGGNDSPSVPFGSNALGWRFSRNPPGALRDIYENVGGLMSSSIRPPGTPPPAAAGLGAAGDVAESAGQAQAGAGAKVQAGTGAGTQEAALNSPSA